MNETLDEDVLRNVRPYRDEDRDAVRAICCRTAYRNLGSKSVFEDDELFADYWTRYYTDFDRTYAYVIEEDGEIIGYFFGCADHKRFARVMGWRIVPKVIATMLLRLVLLRYRNKTSYRCIRWFLTRSWREEPDIPFERYPAHYHCNLLRKGYRKQYNSKLAIRFMDQLVRDGVTHIHASVTEPRDKGAWTRLIQLDGAPAPDAYAEKTSTFFEFVLGDPTPMVNRVWGARVQDSRTWMVMMSKEYKV